MAEEDEESGVFVPLHRRPAGGPSLRREREREQRMTRHAERHQERGVRAPGRARGLSRNDIVAAAVVIADAEGTDAVSMRRVARDLHVGAMSLYWHVASIDELHLLMLEQVQSETEVPQASGDWRADLRAYAASARTATDLPAGPSAGRRTPRVSTSHSANPASTLGVRSATGDRPWSRNSESTRWPEANGASEASNHR